ncbi:hypothetical protein R84B8_02444 [Treponema sp. R8-4-B8]
MIFQLIVSIALVIIGVSMFLLGRYLRNFRTTQKE